MAEEITGDRVEKKVMDDLTELLFSSFDEADDLPASPKGGPFERIIALHDIREATLALTTLIKRGNDQAQHLAQRMVRKLRQALDDNGKICLDRLPKHLAQYTSQPHKEGRTTEAMVSYYRLTGDEVAIEAAILMTNYALEHCFTAHGGLTENAGHHTHSINGLVVGMLDVAVLTNDSSLLQRVKAVFDVALPSFVSSFGWVRENVRVINDKGEGNSSGDYLRGALLLGQAGFAEYFDLAERILRGRLLPSQVLDVDGFSDDPHAREDYLQNLGSRILGGFGFTTPNDLIVPSYVNPYMGYEGADPATEGKLVRDTRNGMLFEHADFLSCKDFPDGVITIYDISSAVVEALCAVWHAIITEDDLGIRVNLLLNCQKSGVSVVSHLSGEGKIDIENASGRNVLVRIPQWALQSHVSLKIDGTDRSLQFVGPYLLVPGDKETQTINVSFPMCKQRTVESMSAKEYTIDWVGDQIVAMSPPAQCLPMFPPCQ